MADRWLTYAELGELMGRSPQAARQRAFRKRWRRQIGNDGMARVLVPEGGEAPPVRPAPVLPPVPGTDHRPDWGTNARTNEAELLKRLGELQAELAALAQRLATAESRAGTAEGELKAIREERDAERARAAELMLQAAQVDALRTERDRLLDHLTQERSERDRLIARVDAAQDRHAAELMVLHERMASAEQARAEAERTKLELTAVHERIARAEHDRDQALEHLEQIQAAHVDELLAIREQIAAVAHDRDRAMEALAAQLALPWWRRLFA